MVFGYRRAVGIFREDALVLVGEAVATCVVGRINVNHINFSFVCILQAGERMVIVTLNQDMCGLLTTIGERFIFHLLQDGDFVFGGFFKCFGHVYPREAIAVFLELLVQVAVLFFQLPDTAQELFFVYSHFGEISVAGEYCCCSDTSGAGHLSATEVSPNTQENNKINPRRGGGYLLLLFSLFYRINFGEISVARIKANALNICQSNAYSIFGGFDGQFHFFCPACE